jgi:hypothetical protein
MQYLKYHLDIRSLLCVPNNQQYCGQIARER